MKTTVITLGALGLSLAAAPAFAQMYNSICPVGTAPSIVRISTIKPGQRALFDKAVKDHRAWYRDHGFTTNEITISEIPETKDGVTWTLSQTKVLSIHRNAPGTPSSTHDAAWQAYVDEYRASSDIATETMACLPAK